MPILPYSEGVYFQHFQLTYFELLPTNFIFTDSKINSVEIIVIKTICSSFFSSDLNSIMSSKESSDFISVAKNYHLTEIIPTELIFSTSLLSSLFLFFILLPQFLVYQFLIPLRLYSSSRT